MLEVNAEITLDAAVGGGRMWVWGKKGGGGGGGLNLIIDWSKEG